MLIGIVISKAMFSSFEKLFIMTTHSNFTITLNNKHKILLFEVVDIPFVVLYVGGY